MENRNYTVYMHRNKTNGKVYIGQTSQPVTHRWGPGGNGYKGQKLIWRAICKYSWDGFTHEIMGSCLTREEADELEIKLIRDYDARNPKKGYNIAFGGGSGNTGLKLSPEAVEKIRARGKLHPPTRECIMKSAEATRIPVVQYDLEGNVVAEYPSLTDASNAFSTSCSLLTSACKGRVKQCHGYVFRYKGDAFDKYDIVQRCNENQKTPIAQYTKAGEKVATYESMADAVRITGLSQGNIGMCCRGERFSTGGYVWRFVDDPFNKFSLTPPPRAKRVCQYDLRTGAFIAEYASAQCASDVTGVHRNSIITVCNGKRGRTHAGGYVWRYVGDGFDKYPVNADAKVDFRLWQFDKDSGALIGTYRDSVEAELKTGANRTAILQCTKGKLCTSGGYVWRCYGDPFDKYPTVVVNARVKPVSQFDKEGNFIKTYDSISEAEIAVGTKNIYKVLNGERRYALGYIWKYAEVI